MLDLCGYNKKFLVRAAVGVWLAFFSLLHGVVWGIEGARAEHSETGGRSPEVRTLYFVLYE